MQLVAHVDPNRKRERPGDAVEERRADALRILDGDILASQELRELGLVGEGRNRGRCRDGHTKRLPHIGGRVNWAPQFGDKLWKKL